MPSLAVIGDHSKPVGLVGLSARQLCANTPDRLPLDRAFVEPGSSVQCTTGDAAVVVVVRAFLVTSLPALYAASFLSRPSAP